MWKICRDTSAYAAVTGASSGIGKAYAEYLAEAGYNLIIIGRRRRELESVAEKIEVTYRRTVIVEIVDLSSPVERHELCEKLSLRDDVSVLINNAGFGLSADFGGEAGEMQLAMAQVHVTTALELTRALLPQLRQSRAGCIVNVSSVAAFFPMPRGAVYSATKAFLLSFSQSLSMELAETAIRVQALCPGMTRTDFHSRMGLEGEEITQRRALVWMSAEAVVESSIRCLTRNRVICIPGIFYRIVVHLFSRMPKRLYYRVVQKVRARPV